MRVTSGILKNKKIKSRKGYDTRPTLERIKEAIFSILSDKVLDSTFLDLYAGTGNMTFEAISRGAKRAILIEENKEALRVIIENVNNLGIEDKCRAYKNDVFRAIEILKNKDEEFNIIFMDAPYKENLTTKTIEKLSEFDILSKDGIIIAEHSTYEKLANKIGNYIKLDERDYNKKVVSMYVRSEHEIN